MAPSNMKKTSVNSEKKKLEERIDKAYAMESKWFREGERLKSLHKKLFEKHA